ncbi:FUN14 domain-containing protein 1-like [Littorina saxatilis]|uniref:FUN14 domain-containing protein 1 n=1 Tax=Littorina saxatilis TaxID=31220 RepID=A0AAN9G1A2_9CAEN
MDILPENDEEYEVLDAININENWFQSVFRRAMGDVSQQSAMKQLGVGSVTGVVAGWLAVKVGKVAAATLGTTVLLVQVAQHQGYISINWDQVRSHLRQAEVKVHRTASRNYPGFFNNVKQFMQENMFVAVGFGGGFLVVFSLWEFQCI